MQAPMKHLFSPEGEAALAFTLAQRPLLAFDFDGTLAPIVSRPDDARVPMAVARRLDRLSGMLPLAIISGRAIDDVRSRLSFEPRYIIGNHGAEDSTGPAVVDRAMVFDELRERLRGRATELDVAGVAVDDKHQSIALHYRLSRDRAQALELIRRLTDGLGAGIHVYGGKLVANVVAAQAPDKASAVASLVQRCAVEAAFFVGDDLNDEPVFVRAEPSWLTVKVGRDDPASRAMFHLDHAGEVASMLDRMLTLLA